MKKKNFNLRVSAIIGVVCVIAVVCAGYIVKLSHAVSANMVNTLSELAAHDKSSILLYIEDTWNVLKNMQSEMESTHCSTVEEMADIMHQECDFNYFSHVYMLGADGSVYSDVGEVYAPEDVAQDDTLNLFSYFTEEKTRVVSQFVDNVEETPQKSVLYGVKLDDFSVGGVKMTAVAGVRHITSSGSLRSRLIIDSFTKDGVSRGHSYVVDMGGNFIVSEEQDESVPISTRSNLFSRLRESKQSELTVEQVLEKMKASESFSFYYTNPNGERKLVYCLPFAEDAIPWYFMMSVGEEVLTEQNHTYLLLSMAMMLLILIIIAVLLTLVMRSQRRALAASSEARARSEFLANMSHDIRTPLNGIIGLIYLLEKDLEGVIDRELVKTRLKKARDTAEYLLSLVNNILDISKLEAGKIETTEEIISPEVIVDAIWSMQKSNLEERGVHFHVSKEIVAPWMLGDEVLIKRVLMNIVGNAAKYTPKGGTIALSVSQKKEGSDRVATTFICKDTGCGMTPEFLEHIWDRFSQEKNNVKTNVKSTGLGMAISKLIVDALGGEIKAESTLGEGSTFTVTFHSKISTEGPSCPVADAPTAATLHEHNGRPIKLLLAEDNELNAELLIEILEGEGFEIVHASNGQEAVDKFEASTVDSYDAILMDMQMPVMDGCTAASKIRALDRSDAKRVLILACTANSFQEDREHAIASGMNDFITKPIEVHTLLKKLAGGAQD